MKNYKIGDYIWYANLDAKIAEEAVIEFITFGDTKILHCEKTLTGDKLVVSSKNVFDTFAEAYDVINRKRKKIVGIL